MGLFPQRFIDDLRLQASILQVVQEYVSLRRAGTKYKGLCPFHAEKTPSFQVDPEKGFFYCFGCHTGGDVFKFLELQEKLDFPEAVRLLAQKVGMALPEPTEEDGGGRPDAALRETLLKAHEVAAAYFLEALESPSGGRARQQLRDRGIAPDTTARLGLGYAPPARTGLTERLMSQGFSEALLVQSGLVLRRDSSTGSGRAEIVDRFRNRLMIPICRDTGSVVAFGGRAMDGDQVPKYLNSPETPIYSKGRILYGLNVTKAAVRKLGYVVLVEGYFDFAQVMQTDAAPVVASCGTALTPQQAQLLRRFTTKIVLSFDQDAAGQSAAGRSCDLLVTEGFDVNVVVLEKGEDPDTFIRRHGPEQYRERLRTSRPYLEYLLDQGAQGVDFGHDEPRREFLNQMLAVAARIPDVAARDQFADRIAHRARITEEVVRAEIRKAAAHRRTNVTARELPAFGSMKHAEKGLIWGLFHDTGGALEALDELEDADLESLTGGDIFREARILARESAAFLPSALLQRLSTGDAQLVAGIAAASTAPAPAAECARALKRLRWERERAALQREIDRLQELGAGQHEREIDALWQRKKDLLHRIEELT
jgi:DNA primase